jgi:hypothetical protein
LYEILIQPSGNGIDLDTISKDLGAVVNAMGYRITDNYIYGMDPYKATMSRIGSDGVAVDLGKPKGIPDTPIYFAGDITPDGNYLLVVGIGLTSPQIVKIDLNDPEYGVSFVPLSDRTVGLVDIAFDPFSGELYGHDYNHDRIVIVDPNTGVVNDNFKIEPRVDQLGGLFFDSFGNLYGYGSYNSSQQDKFIGIDKKTGEMRLLATGPLSIGQDGCACPYTMELQKTVTPDTAYACTEVVYNFIVSNGSGETRQNIQITDTMPHHLRPQRILRNPFGGIVSIKDNVIRIDSMVVKPGIDTVKVVVLIDRDAVGDYKNQAEMSGLPPSLGERTLSDNPHSVFLKDSTILHVLPLDLKYINDTIDVCLGDSTWYDVRRYGLTYQWSDGIKSGARFLKSPNVYGLTITDACDTYLFNIKVTDDYVSVDIEADTIDVDLGDSVLVQANYFNTNDAVSFKWYRHGDTKIQCSSCQSTHVFPIFSSYLSVEMTNDQGCVVSDSVYLRVAKDYEIYAPNIISADGNGVNDVFFLTGKTKAAKGLKMQIYDRWGNLVFAHGPFELSDISYGWDGYFNRNWVVNGVYAWTAEIIFIDKVVKNYFGDLTVIR